MTKAEFMVEMAGALMVPPETVRAESELASFEGWDSTAVLNLMAILEESVGVTIEPEKISQCVTVQDLINLCDGKLA